jgi:hypothetical protein
MQIKIKLDPGMNDLVVTVGLVNALTEIAMKADPAQARALRKAIGYRLKRMKQVST